MGRARSRAIDDADEADDARRRVPPHEFGQTLRTAHDGLGFWRLCTHKACKRARRCRGDIDICARTCAGLSAWLEHAMKGERAGLSTEEASRRATALVWPSRAQQPPAAGQRAIQR